MHKNNTIVFVLWKVHTVHSNLHFLNENFGASQITPSLSQPTVQSEDEREVSPTKPVL